MSSVPYCFQVKVTGCKRFKMSKPPRYEARFVLYRRLDEQLAIIKPGAKQTLAVPGGNVAKIIFPNTVMSPMIEDLLFKVKPVPEKMLLKVTLLLKVAALSTVTPLLVVIELLWKTTLPGNWVVSFEVPRTMVLLANT